MSNLDQALKLFRDAIKRSEDTFDAKEVLEVEEKIAAIIAEDPTDPELAVEAAVYELWPNCGGYWEYNPTRFVL